MFQKAAKGGVECSSEGQQLSNFSYHIMFHRQALGSLLCDILAIESHPKKNDMQISGKNRGFKPTCPVNLIEFLGATSHLFTKIRRLTREFHPMLEGWSQHRLAILTLRQLKSRKCLWRLKMELFISACQL